MFRRSLLFISILHVFGMWGIGQGSGYGVHTKPALQSPQWLFFDGATHDPHTSPSNFKRASGGLVSELTWECQYHENTKIWFIKIEQLVDISYGCKRKFTFCGDFWMNRSCRWIRTIWYTFSLFTKLIFFARSFLLTTATYCFIFVIGYLMASIGCFYASTKMISTKTMPVLAVVHVFCLTFIVCLTFLLSFEFILNRSKFRSRRLDRLVIYFINYLVWNE